MISFFRDLNLKNLKYKFLRSIYEKCLQLSCKINPITDIIIYDYNPYFRKISLDILLNIVNKE